MRLAIAGGSGLIGRHVMDEVFSAGHDVVAVSRSPQDHAWPGVVEAVSYEELDLGPVDAVVNLAGASIAGKRWTGEYKRLLVESRTGTTKALADAISALPVRRRPALVNASAVGYYGRYPEGVCHEARPPGDDFLAQLCVAWEEAAVAAPTRVVRLRFGHVLDDDEGLIGRLLPIYKARMGGPLGSGKQGLPWVHVLDVARAVRWAVESDAEGPYNVAAPGHVTQREFNDMLAERLEVFARIPVPGIALRIAVGGLGPYLIGGQHTPPSRLVDEGFRFRHPELREALADLVGPPSVTQHEGPLPAR